jgi:hypothetical protein
MDLPWQVNWAEFPRFTADPGQPNVAVIYWTYDRGHHAHTPLTTVKIRTALTLAATHGGTPRVRA